MMTVRPLRRLFASLCTLLITSTATSVAQEVFPLSYDEALARAEKMNVDVLIGRESVQQAIEARIRARGALLPQLDATASQSRSKNRSGFTGNEFSGQLVGSMTLLDIQRIADFNVQKVGERAARTSFEQGVQTVLDTVSTLYFSHLRNLRRLDLNQANIERAEVLLRLARSQLDAGVATQIDVTRAEAQLATQQQQLLQQQTATFDSELQLKRALEIPEEANLQIREFSAARSLDPSLASLAGSSVLDKRLDYQAQQQQLEQNRLEVRAARYQRAPSLRLSAGAGLGSEVFWEGDYDDSWNIGVSASVPIFDGFQIESNKRLADSRVRAQELRVNNLQRRINDEVRLALRDAQSRLSQIAVAEKNASLAEEELRLARIRFEQGVADNREVVDAQNSLAAANDNLNDALFLYNLSRLELARVRGDVRLLLGERG
jgi:outer membrane protein TolC